MLQQNIKHIGVIGTGVIGTGWATYFLSKGFEVTASDPAPGAEKNLWAGIAANDPTLPLNLLHFESDPEKAVRDVQFVQENGPERLVFKQELFKRLDACTDPSVLLVSSSSGITPSEFQLHAKHPERILLGHPFNPPHLIPLVEVCGGKAMSEEAIQQTLAFYTAIGKKPIRLNKEMKGHVANRLQAALWQEAFYLVQQGVVSAEDVDLAISHGPGLRWALLGPFLNLYLSGGQDGIKHFLEHVGPSIQTWLNDLGKIEINDELIALLSKKVDEMLEGKDIRKIENDRNRVLLALMDMKDKAENLP
jgi:3-hydroxyacyl-CoA dehydrogenase